MQRRPPHHYLLRETLLSGERVTPLFAAAPAARVTRREVMLAAASARAFISFFIFDAAFIIATADDYAAAMPPFSLRHAITLIAMLRYAAIRQTNCCRAAAPPLIAADMIFSACCHAVPHVCRRRRYCLPPLPLCARPLTPLRMPPRFSLLPCRAFTLLFATAAPRAFYAIIAYATPLHVYADAAACH